jgi:hypothetical protein
MQLEGLRLGRCCYCTATMTKPCRLPTREFSLKHTAQQNFKLLQVLVTDCVMIREQLQCCWVG